MPVGSDSTFNANTGEWESKSVGSVDKSGNYVPPQGYEVTETGEILKEVAGEQKLVVAPVVPTVSDTPPLNALPVSDVKVIDGRIPAGGSDNPDNADSNTSANGAGENQPVEGEGRLLPPPPSSQCLTTMCNTYDSGTGGPAAEQPRIPAGGTRVKVIVR